MDTTTKPKVKLVGTDGNVFSIMGKVSKALKKAGQTNEADEYRKRVFAAGSYDEALQITMEYVEVS